MAHTASPYAQGDGTYYYLYLRSALFDRDLDFSNDLALLGQPFNLGISHITGRPKNFWTCGSAVFWSPFAAYARIHLAVTNALGITNEIPNGAGPIAQRITLFGSVAAGLAALWLTFALCRRTFSARNSLFAVVALAFATPLSWYMLRQPSFSHANSAVAVAIFVTLWYGTQGGRSTRVWVLLGAALGLAMLVRPQDAIHAVLPLTEWCVLALAALRLRERKALGSLVIKGLAFALSATSVYFVQLLAWRRIYGRWVLDPHEAHFLEFKSSRFLEVLFSSRFGLFSWHPLVYVAVIGLVAVALSGRIEKKARTFARLALVVFALQAIVNGATVDWWGGWSFGGRRFLGCTIYFGFGLAMVLDSIVAAAQRWSSIVLKFALPMALLFVPSIINLQLADDYGAKRIPPGLPQDMLQLWTGATSRILASVYDSTGNIGSAPLNWWLAAAANTSPAKYDLLSSAETFYDHRAPESILLSDDRYSLAGFGPKMTLEGRVAHWVQGAEATWGFALRRAEAIVADVTVFVPRAPAHVRLVVGGSEVAKQDLPSPGWTHFNFLLPATSLRSGINIARIEQLAPAPTNNTDLPGLAWGTVTLAPAKP
ncbi:MAG: glycosyltransferase family 39 protein [Deltaproteobacteria bacterium]|nr:glycosyltransferase family 39 protein [Deltaproteobacteria bacterium]